MEEPIVAPRVADRQVGAVRHDPITPRARRLLRLPLFRRGMGARSVRRRRTRKALRHDGVRRTARGLYGLGRVPRGLVVAVNARRAMQDYELAVCVRGGGALRGPPRGSEWGVHRRTRRKAG